MWTFLVRSRLPSHARVVELPRAVRKAAAIHRALHTVSSRRLNKAPGPAGTTSRPSTGTEAPEDVRKRLIFPERLLIYHAGTGRTTFLAIIKVTTVFAVAFFCTTAASVMLDPDQPAWKPVALTAAGLVPFAFVAYTTRPFVASVHLHLPPYARASRAILLRFARNPTLSSTRLDLRTVGLLGMPRVERKVALAELRAFPKRGCQPGGRGSSTRRVPMTNYYRQRGSEPDGEAGAAAANAGAGAANTPAARGPTTRTGAAAKSQKWYAIGPPSQFLIEDDSKHAKEGWVWRELAAGMARRRDSAKLG